MYQYESSGQLTMLDMESPVLILFQGTEVG